LDLKYRRKEGGGRGGQGRERKGKEGFGCVK